MDISACGVRVYVEKILWLFSDFYWIGVDKSADNIYNGGKKRITQC
jgi:hypothetical protein|tara:strand:- start:132 stop:269 length:138 start_codon:yes stop_codon:yes gene_type:complete